MDIALLLATWTQLSYWLPGLTTPIGYLDKALLLATWTELSYLLLGLTTPIGYLDKSLLLATWTELSYWLPEHSSPPPCTALAARFLEEPGPSDSCTN